MLLSLALTTVLGSTPLACELQPGAIWATEPADVSAIACEGRRGIFVPSLEFRRIDLLARQVPLLEEENRLLAEANVDLQLAVESSSVAEAFEHGRADANWKLFLESNLALEASIAREKEAARRSWYESPFLWTGVGATVAAGVILAVLFASQ